MWIEIEKSIDQRFINLETACEKHWVSYFVREIGYLNDPLNASEKLSYKSVGIIETKWKGSYSAFVYLGKGFGIGQTSCKK